MNLLIKKSILPFGFILLYGSGFVFIEFGLKNSSPMVFLASRFFIAFVLLISITYILKVPINKNIKEILHISMAGILSLAVFTIGVTYSLSYGISSSLSALIIALQPIVVSFFALKFLGEDVNKKVWLGLIIGLAGVAFVVYSKSDNSINQMMGIVCSIIALFGVSFGSLYQKKYCSNMNIFYGGAIQTFVSSIVVLPFLMFENININFNTDFIIALLYMAIGVSIGAVSLLYIMIKNGEVSKVSSLFYLVPVSAVIVSYLFFNANLEPNVIVGIITVIIGITLINKKEKT